MNTVKIGQILYEPRRHGYFHEHVVVAIGRKWISLDTRCRCSIDGLMLDRGQYSPVNLYPDIETYKQERRLAAAWSDFSSDVYRARRPDGLTVEAINEIRQKLGLQVLETAEEKS